MESSTWDVFSSKDSTGSLWFAVQLCRGLADKGETVRLFTDAVSSLGVLLTDLDADLWMQSCAGFQLADRRLSTVAQPARNLVQMFDSKVPSNYLTRYVSQRAGACWMRVERVDAVVEGSGPMSLIEATSTYSAYSTQIGDLPDRAGYLRQYDRVPTPRARRQQKVVPVGLLNLLGLPPTILEGKTVVFMDGEAGAPMQRWARMLTSQAEEVCLFVEQGSLQGLLSEVARLEPDCPGFSTVDSLTTVFLPPLAWYVVDEVLAASHVVLTSAPDTAARAAEVATPVLWGGGGSSEPQFLRWYAGRARPSIQDALGYACEAVATGNNCAQAWNWYRSIEKDVFDLAAEVSDRIYRGPDLSDVLHAAVRQDDHGQLVNQFLPTQPTAQHFV